MYIPKSEFGWNRRAGWLHGDEAGYNNAVALMKTVQPGRQRSRPIHPSWADVLKHFDSTNPWRSQGAFCRWADLNRGTFSAMQCKPLLSHTEYLISQWVEEIECVDFGIMPQFQSEYERLMEKD